jgi:oligoendopeptidase F
MERSQVQESHKWKIEDIYPTDEDWEKEYEVALKRADFSAYAGKLGDKATLLKFLKANDEFMKVLERLAVYANLRRDEDTRISKYASYEGKTGMLFSKYSSSVAFYEPELASQSESYLNDLVNDKDFADYDYQIKRLIKSKPHVLSEGEEKIIALAGETLDTFSDTFAMIDNADLPLPTIEYEGKTVKLTHGLYGLLLHSNDRAKRKEVFEKYYLAYQNMLNTITSTYYGNVKKDVFLKEAYKFNSCLERALFNEDVDKKVYDNLLNSVSSNLSSMHRYIADRKKILGYDKMYFYDIYAPLVSDVEVKMSYEEAYAYIIKGFG